MEAKNMEFGEAYEIMRMADDFMKHDKFFVDDFDGKVHRIYDTVFETWNEEEGFWEAVHEDIQDVMSKSYSPTDDPTGFHYTFAQAINMMRNKGVKMENDKYRGFTYKYDGRKGTFVCSDGNCDFLPASFKESEVSGKWKLNRSKE